MDSVAGARPWPASGCGRCRHLLGVSVATLAVVHLLDVARHENAHLSLWDVFARMSPGDAEHIMSGIGEVIAAILGIVITVASIIVQLAANRYTPRITEMFFRDRTNMVVMGFFVVSAVFSLWINFSIRVGRGGPTEDVFVPPTASSSRWRCSPRACS